MTCCHSDFSDSPPANVGVKIFSGDIGMEFKIEKCAMFMMKENGKRETTEEIEMLNQESIRTRKLQIPGNIRSRHHQVNRVERKSKKNIPQKNKNILETEHSSGNLIKEIST